MTNASRAPQLTTICVCVCACECACVCIYRFHEYHDNYCVHILPHTAQTHNYADPSKIARAEQTWEYYQESELCRS